MKSFESLSFTSNTLSVNKFCYFHCQNKCRLLSILLSFTWCQMNPPSLAIYYLCSCWPISLTKTLMLTWPFYLYYQQPQTWVTLQNLVFHYHSDLHSYGYPSKSLISRNRFSCSIKQLWLLKYSPPGQFLPKNIHIVFFLYPPNINFIKSQCTFSILKSQTLNQESPI